jgi:hypothetical protein
MLPARLTAQPAETRGLPSRPGGISADAHRGEAAAAAQRHASARPEILEATPDAGMGSWRVDGARNGRDAGFQPFAYGVMRGRVQIVDAEWVVDVPLDADRSADLSFEAGGRAGTDRMLGLRMSRFPLPADPATADPGHVAAAAVTQDGALARLALSLYRAVAEGPAGRRSIDLFV